MESGSDQELRREIRVAAVRAFIDAVGIDRAAEYVVDLRDAVDGLRRNNKALTEALRVAVATISKARGK